MCIRDRGSWCVALAVQNLSCGNSAVWAGARSVYEGEGNGMCYSFDHGTTWCALDTTKSLICWNFAFAGDTVYFACEQGLYRACFKCDSIFTEDTLCPGDSIYTGDSLYYTALEKLDIIDTDAGYHAPLDQMISAAVVGETLWVGTDFGIAYSPDRGETWSLLFKRNTPEWKETYAFPSPFSPHIHGTMFFVFNNTDYGEIKLSIFDFALEELVSISRICPAGVKQMIQWDGKDSNERYPSNGIYHYRITLPDGTEMWGKFAFLR